MDKRAGRSVQLMVQVATVRSVTDPVSLASILEAYGFEGTHEDTPILLGEWIAEFSAQWTALAIVEAVYQGRYKVLSVRQILLGWQRRGEPRTNFDRTFQRQILEDSWQPLIPPPSLPLIAVAPTVPFPTAPQRLGRQPVVNRLRELIGVA